MPEILLHLLGRRQLTSNQLLLRVAAFMLLFDNWTLFGKVLDTYGMSAANAPALLALALMQGGAIVLLAGLTCYGRAAKPVLALLLLVGALCAYFMDSYGIVIDDEMLQNVVQTNPGEARDLLNFRLATYLLLLGVLPAWWLARVPLLRRRWPAALWRRLVLLTLTLLLMVGLLLAFGSFFASFAREHKALRSYANPTYPLYSLAKFIRGQAAVPADKTVAAIGTDAHIPDTDPHRELIFLVVGETARADHFSLNGYARQTNPRLGAMDDVISFTRFQACGTSTAVSLPCMFSLTGSADGAAGRENLLDVVQRAGAHVLWLDNNSDSKGVALRVPYRDFKSPEVNPVCDVECRDEGMLVNLQEAIDSLPPTGDILIVLHQMGNHGPAYYKRYPPAFEKFVPACKNNDLSQCTREEIINAYDNALLYTDHFLATAIELLKRNDDRFETALFYVSDHGESLGEGGTYLHGLPRAIAPQAQLHVPAILWIGGHYHEVNVPVLRARRDAPFGHEHLFHTLLGFMEIQTSIYRPELDILEGARKSDWTR